MEFKLEVVVVPVRDVDRSLVFYTEQLGFCLDVDYAPNPGFRVVQMTPPGSACSVQIGVGISDAAPGSVRGLYLVVSDIEQARADLVAGGVAVGEIRHKSPVGSWQGGFEPGVHAERLDYASFAEFADPDGNRWTVQEVGFPRS
ncbi:VOC family protein [Kitasatospora sp. NPDC052896]|uniref:VOC family protein n=1 Tax=Kitasatospora sp. NPDC052896 TaxID=3364061 RepID=UPI0037CCA604